MKKVVEVGVKRVSELRTPELKKKMMTLRSVQVRRQLQPHRYHLLTFIS